MDWIYVCICFIHEDNDKIATMFVFTSKPTDLSQSMFCKGLAKLLPTKDKSSSCYNPQFLMCWSFFIPKLKPHPKYLITLLKNCVNLHLYIYFLPIPFVTLFFLSLLLPSASERASCLQRATVRVSGSCHLSLGFSINILKSDVPAQFIVT